MNSSKFRFTLDLHKTQSQISIPITLGDTARMLLISFSDGSTPYTIPDGCLAKIEIKRPTGTHLEAFCPIENNTTVKYSFSQNEHTAVVEGIHECAVILYDAEGDRVASPRFTMVVSDRVIDNDDIDITDSDVTAVDAMIAAEAGRQLVEKERQASETLRISAEEKRDSAETERTAAEALRATAEAARALAESKREAAETARAEAEAGRNLAETERAAAEEKRNEEELARASAEAYRSEIAKNWALDEAQRQQNEALRADEERSRAETERNRSAAEAQRAAAENARIRAENERVNAERARQQRFDENIDNMLPDTTAEDDGKVMVVSGGAWVPKKIAGIEDIELSVEMDENHVVTISLKNSKGDVLASGFVDLPLESAIVGGREEDGKLVFELQSGDTIEVNIGDIISGLVSQETFDSHTGNKANPHGVTASQVGAAPTSHKHQKSEISDFPTSMTPTAHTHSKTEISDFPTKMAPTAHTHTKSDVTDFAHTHTKSQISDFPSSMTPSAHNQAASTITAGTFGGQVVANASASASVAAAQVRNISAGTADMTAGTSSLATGSVYFVYE